MKSTKGEELLTRFYRGMIYILPAVLFFSYRPLISLGASDTMNFELSLPLIWLVVFNVVAVIMMMRRKILFRGCSKKWVWMLLPGFLTLSLLWSLNFLRGVLTVGILWLIFTAIYAFFNLKSILKEVGARETFWKVFWGSSLVVCGWCFLQCILNLAGVSRTETLMCAGCTYEMFGFPHPNGFAIEPQFMGNLLLAPAIVAGWMMISPGRFRKAALPKCNFCQSSVLLFFIFAATIFLTFSRGAIYAFVMAMIFMTVMEWVRQKNWKICKTFLVIVVAFLFTLNLQGVMAQVSPTNDTYGGGVAKVINQLSLGIIDIRGGDETKEESKTAEEMGALALENTEVNEENNKDKQAVFDGYVVESTETRKRLTEAALTIWQKDFKTVMFGVGLGGAGQALYVNGLSPAPKEIVQNQYASLLLETGLVGIAFLILTLALVARAVYRSAAREMLFALILAYGISLCFFSGLPNALHIYLLPAILMVILGDGKNWYHRY